MILASTSFWTNNWIASDYMTLMWHHWNGTLERMSPLIPPDTEGAKDVEATWVMCSGDAKQLLGIWDPVITACS